MDNTYWSGKGKYQADYDRLVELMPSMGACDTVAGELIRAASRIGYDFYNNGMGNNTSGAVNYLKARGAIDPAVYATIYEYSRGAVYHGHYEGDDLQVAVERAVDQTIEFIQLNPNTLTDANSEDMFEYEDPFQNWCEECGDEIGQWGSVCSHCEEAYYEEEEEEEY